MELKKNEEVNNDRLRYPMIFVGLLFTGSLVLASFTYSTPAEDKSTADTLIRDTAAELEIDPKVEDTPPPPPQQQQAPITPPPSEAAPEKKTEPEPPKRDPSPPAPPIPPAPDVQPVKQAEIVDFPEVDAAFPGGAAAMTKWIQENVVYPEISRELGDQGRVYVSFVVETDGSISGVDVLRSVTPELDKEAKRLVRSMPAWQPGEVKGDKVRARCRLPITFTLQ